MPSPYVSAISGNFDASDVNTWGQGIGVYPNLANDVVTITAGHTVIYNVNSPTQLGAITINGILYCHRGINTRLALGHEYIVINGGGKLNWGTVADRIPDPLTAVIEWNTTVDAAKGINLVNGGFLFVCGDPVFYGNDFDTELQADWNAGQTFTVLGDFTTKWRNGQELALYRNVAYNNWTQDYYFCTIQGMALVGGNTQITINEAFPGLNYKTGGTVLNLSRNIIFRKVGASMAVNNMNVLRPWINIGTLATKIIGSEYYIKDTEFIGFYNIGRIATYSPYLENVVIRNSESLFNPIHKFQIKNTVAVCLTRVFNNSCKFGMIDGIYIIGVQYPYYGMNNNYIINGHIKSSLYGLSSPTDSYFSGTIAGCSTAVYGGLKSSINAFIYNNTVGIGLITASRVIFSGTLGWDPAGNSKPNITDINVADVDITLRNVKLPLAGIIFQSLNNFLLSCDIKFQDYNQVPGAHQRIKSVLSAIKDTINIRPGGNSSSIRIVPTAEGYIPTWRDIFTWTESPLTAGAKTRTVYVKGTAWAAFPTAAELYFEVEYYPVGTYVPVVIKSTAVLVDNVTWTPFSVTFTPEPGTRAVYGFYSSKYQAAASINIDNMLIRTGHPDGNVKGEWADGCAVIYADSPNFPAITNVRNAIIFDDGQTGSLVVPAVGNVRAGTIFDGGSIGLLDLPAENDVRKPIAFDQATKTGLCVVPVDDDVRFGIPVDVADAGLLDLPAEADVRLGVAFDQATKTGTLASQSFILPLEGRTQNPQTIIGIVEK